MADKKNNNFTLILIIYLLGIFMGALDTGIVTPARTIIQSDLNVSDTFGIWMITIYTLAYAASIPIMGKLADRMGRKYIYLIAISLFGTGSLLCGLSQGTGSFYFLLGARVIQALGGGGIVPVATAEFGTTFPEEKRGMALGLVGGVYGVANILGASAGSAILDIFGVHNWQFIFYLNVPISAFIIIAGIYALPNTKEERVLKTDIWGIMLLTVMILSLMYGLKNIDFFDFTSTVSSTKVYPFLILFVLLLPVFITAEKKAEDPVMNLTYFRKLPIAITLFLSFVSGIILMGLIFVPQFCENAMEIPTGDGGYFVIILGVFAGVSAPLSGKLIDKIGVKIVLAAGFMFALAGSLSIIMITTKYPNIFTVALSLVLIGFGIGFTMGAPLNYMMLDNVDDSESNSALATLSLVRSVATVIAPAIMVGFLSHAGMSVQDDIMKVIPDEVTLPQLPYAQELSDAMKSSSSAKAFDFASMTKVKINTQSGSSDIDIPDDVIDDMKNSDVTTIVASTKEFSSAMFTEMSPKIISKIDDGIDSGISGMTKASVKMSSGISGMEKAKAGMSQGISGMKTAVAQQDKAIAKLQKAKNGIDGGITKLTDARQKLAARLSNMKKAQTGIENGITGLKAAEAQSKAQIEGYSAALGVLQGHYSGTGTLADSLPESIKPQLSDDVISGLASMTSISELQKKIGALQGAVGGMESKIAEMQKQADSMTPAISGMENGLAEQDAAIAKMQAQSDKISNDALKPLITARNKVSAKLAKLENSSNKMSASIAELKSAQSDMNDNVRKMKVLKAAVPGAFTTAEKNYTGEISARSTQIREVFQAALAKGFSEVYATTAVASLAGLLLLSLYRGKRREEKENV